MTAKKNNPRQRWVTPAPSGGSNVQAPGAKRACVHPTTKAQATDAARGILRRAGGGELRVQNSDGRIANADTVPNGASRAASIASDLQPAVHALRHPDHAQLIHRPAPGGPA